MNTAQTDTIKNASFKSISDKPVIEINNLKKSFGKQEVLTNVSLKLFNGENLVVVGKSGTGKSVLIQLSGGMRKRISLARTIVVDPMIMLYDEPTTGLDPVTADEISSLINDVQKKYKTSSIIITHDIKCARNTANRIIMLKEGEVYKEGKVEDFENSTDPLIKSFFM